MPRPANNPYGERVLRIDPPMTGRDVWDLQIKLIGWGSGSDNEGIGSPMMPVRVTGTYDAATRDAVKRFQTVRNLPVNGIVDSAVFEAIDAEAALYPVIVHSLRCACANGKNAGPILCRCSDPHPGHASGVCDGFGHARFGGLYLLDYKTLPDGTNLSGEQLDVYDQEEYPGMDKAVIWAVRALMRRAGVPRISVVAGYRCWQDNYHHYGPRRLSHRTGTFHLGKTIELRHDGACAAPPPVPPVVCARCTAIRDIAIQRCGFQPRWQEPDRVTVGDVSLEGQPPRSPDTVMISTVRRRERPPDEFVKTFKDSLKPLYKGNIASVSFPLRFHGPDSLDPLQGSAQMYFTNSERGAGGRYPIGPSRIWHGGMHLFQPLNTEVRAIADGEVVGCRVGEAVNVEPYGSRNFVLIRHKLQAATWYSLYMHLDAGAAAASPVPWRLKLHALTADHVEMDAPCPLFTSQNPGPQGFLQPEAGLAAGTWVPLVGGALVTNPRVGGPALDLKAPLNSEVIEVVAPVVGNRYVFLKMDNQVLGRKVDASVAVTNAIANTTSIGLASPIPVKAGELVGYVAAAPTDAGLNPHGTFLHLEVFADHQLMTGEGITAIQLASENEVVTRSDVVAKLKAAHLMDGVPNDILLASDFTTELDRSQLMLRGVQLKCRSAWKMNWTNALTARAADWQIAAGARNTAAGHMDAYSWWDDVNGNNRLPASPDVWHAHPISWLMHLADEMNPAPA